VTNQPPQMKNSRNIIAHRRSRVGVVTRAEAYHGPIATWTRRQFLARTGRWGAGAELGHGVIDYRPIFAAAEKAGLKHYFAEQEGPFTRMSELEAARQAYRYLRRLP
jgi:sugar phosphate isomerase/epimerase